jgi:hypothetical protein
MVENGVAIRTELDGLGCRADGAPVVVEIKATGASLKEHQAGYRNVCIKRQRMLSGHPNTLDNRHQIQVAFGALCCGTRAGIIVVSCRDGVTSYPLRYVSTSATTQGSANSLVIGAGTGQSSWNVVYLDTR